MKKIWLSILALISISLISCEWFTDPSSIPYPKKVKVKTEAAFSFNLGEIKPDLGDQFDLSSIKSSISENLGDGVDLWDYEYSASPNTLAYLMHYPIYELPIDVGSYLSQLDLDAALSSNSSGMNFNQELKIDAINYSGTETVIDDITAKLTEYLETIDLKTISPLYVPESDFSMSEITHTLANSELNISDSFDIEIPADQLSYKENSSLNIIITKTDPFSTSDDYTFLIGTQLKDKSDNILCTVPPAEYKNGGTIVIPLGYDVIEGEYLPEEFSLYLDGSISGNNPLIIHTYRIEFEIGSQSKVKRIVNLKKTSDELGIEDYEITDMNQDLDVGDYFTEATIEQGSLRFSSPLPQGWSNLDVDIKILSVTGLISADKDEFTDGPDAATSIFDKELDLSDKPLDPANPHLTVNGLIHIEVEGSTLDFTDDDVSIDVNYDAHIDSLKNVKVDLASPAFSGMQTSFSLPSSGNDAIQLPEEIKDYIEEITFGTEAGGKYYKSDAAGNVSSTEGKGLGIKCVITNDLDTTIPLHISSNIFGLDIDDSITTGEDETEHNWITYDTLVFNESTPGYVDFSFEITDTLITINHFVLGETYSLAVDVDNFVFDWDSAKLKTSDAFSGNQDLEGLDISSVMKSLPIPEEDINKIEIATLPASFYAQKPDASSSPELAALMNSLNISGKISIDTTKNDVVTSNYLLGTESSNGTLQYANKITWPAKNSDILIKDSDELLNEEINTPTFKIDLAPIFNSKPDKISFNYSVGLNGATVYNQMIEDMKASGETTANITIDLLLKLIFNLTVKEDISLSVMDLVDSEWSTSDSDLFGREDASSLEQYAEYANAIDSMGVKYKIKSSLLSGLNLGLNVKNGTYLDKDVTIVSNEYNTLQFTRDEIKNILTKYPFHPDVALKIGQGELFIPRSITEQTDSAPLEVGLSVFLKMNDEPITVYPFEESLFAGITGE